MKAVVVKQFGEANFEQVADYQEPVVNDESVLVRIKAAAFNPVDYKIRKGITNGMLALLTHIQVSLEGKYHPKV